jgi:hypothetical protein
MIRLKYGFHICDVQYSRNSSKTYAETNVLLYVTKCHDKYRKLKISSFLKYLNYRLTPIFQFNSHTCTTGQAPQTVHILIKGKCHLAQFTRPTCIYGSLRRNLHESWRSSYHNMTFSIPSYTQHRPQKQHPSQLTKPNWKPAKMTTTQYRNQI